VSEPALHPELAELRTPVPAWLRETFAVPRREGEVVVEGCPIRYLEWGDARDPGVVMVHGYMAHARCLAMVAPLLADRYHVVAYDISGMGDSGARSTYDDAVRAQELHAVAAHTGMFDTGVAPFVVAHSYGCTVTFSAMERWGSAFGGAILCDLMLMRPERQAAFFADRDAGIAAASGKRVRGPSPDLESIIARFRLEPEQPVAHPVLREYVARHSVREVDGGWTWKFSPTIFGNLSGGNPSGNAAGGGHGWWGQLAERLRDLPVRNAFVYGARSSLFDADSVAWLREIGVTRTPFIPIAHAHHHIMLDEPVAFASALRAVLEMWRG
jgi:pimeloyl-ACP methyl ester carboxylesterase